MWNRLFNPENKFWEFIGKLTDVACLSLLWAVTCLPVITFGAATTSFYQFTLRQVSDTEGTVWSSYFRAFRQNFKKSTQLWLIQLAGLVFFAVDLYGAWCFLLYTDGAFYAIAVFAVVLCITLLFLGCTFYFYPPLAMFDFPLKKILHDSFIMAVGNLPVTITLFLLLALMYVGIYFLSGFFFFLAGLFIFISSYLIYGVFRKYTGELAEEERLLREQKEEKALRQKMNRLHHRM